MIRNDPMRRMVPVGQVRVTTARIGTSSSYRVHLRLGGSFCPKWIEASRMNHVEADIARDLHPVDVIEHVAHSNDWCFERTGDDELSISVAGVWSDYHVSFSWMADFEALHLACAFDIKVPENRATEVARLLSIINEQMLI